MADGLEVRGLSVRWGETPVLTEVGLEVGPQEFVTLVGPNGSGKSTLLRTIVGLEPPSAGDVLWNGRSIVGVPTHRRGIGLVFQETTLLPRRTVRENVSFGPEIQGWPVPEVEARVDLLLDLLDLTSLGARPSGALSGGERQRVALARALAPRPKLVLLDEPFASVDPELRSELRATFRHVLRSTQTAALHVTHDREEGAFLGDRMALLMGGRVVRSGSPEELLDDPRTVEVARFLGYNILRDPTGWFAVHPDDTRVAPGGARGLPGAVLAAGASGAGWTIFVRTEDGGRWEVHGPRGDPRPSVGDRVALTDVRRRALSG